MTCVEGVTHVGVFVGLRLLKRLGADANGNSYHPFVAGNVNDSPGLAFARNTSSVKENQIREPGPGFTAMPGCPGGGRGVTDKWL